MSPRKILFTGFEPFGGEAVNASWEAVRQLDGRRFGESMAVAVMLPCAYGASVEALVSAFERLRPHGVIMTGQAASRAIISVERFAHAIDTAEAPDNRGVRGAKAVVAGPYQLEAHANIGEIVRAIRATGVPARASRNAGGYVCNHLYYGALSHLSAAQQTPAVFIHLPATPQQTPPRANRRRLPTPDAVRALEAIADAIIVSSLA